MKTSFIALGLIAGTIVSTPGDASQLTTEFGFTITVGHVSSSLPIPTPEGQYIILPAALSNWQCQVRKRYLSNDGSFMYHNIVCDNIATTTNSVTVGTTVVCPIQKEGSDSGDFFLNTTFVDSTRIVGSTGVTFFGWCITHSVGTANPTPTRNL